MFTYTETEMSNKQCVHKTNNLSKIKAVTNPLIPITDSTKFNQIPVLKCFNLLSTNQKDNK